MNINRRGFFNWASYTGAGLSPGLTARFKKAKDANTYVYMKALIVLALGLFSSIQVLPQIPEISKYNVVWNTPSTDPSGQMPLGNGDIAAGAYVLEGDALYLLLSKNDAFTYNGDIFKTGRVRIDISPNPFQKGAKFRQTLDLETASISIDADDVDIRIWADANRPIYHIRINSEKDIDVTATPEFWERQDGSPWNLTSEPVDPPTQDVFLEGENSLIWYYAVGDRSVFPTEMKFYEVPQLLEEFPDPYRFNTFGNLMESTELDLNSGQLKGSGKQFDIRIHAQCAQIPDINEWLSKIEEKANKLIDSEKHWLDHIQWWRQFWARSWMAISDNSIPTRERGVLNGEGYRNHREESDKGAIVAQNYNIYRYLIACQSRGRIQTKFNGGLFTQPLRFGPKDSWSTDRTTFTGEAGKYKLSHVDDRDWGRRYTFQNQRLLYWPLFMSGDLDLTRPFFSYYSKLLPVRKAITSAWFGHEGAYYRENIEPTGGERDCGQGGIDLDFRPPRTAPGENDGNGYYHSYYFTCGLEILAMMLEYAQYSDNQSFIQDTLLPFSREILLFFDQHYPRDAGGKIRLDPAMVLETFWIAVNPAPDVAGLHYCIDALLELGFGSANDIGSWKRMKSELPDVPLNKIENRMAIAPAEEYDFLKNAENGELYPVFPFNLFGLAQGTEDIVEWTMKHRTNKDAFGIKCWTQDQIHWAYAGNASEAQEGMISRYSHASTQCRFPVYGSRQPDSCPDFDHFGSGNTALQRMLVQEDGKRILLLPAWPANWDVDFKLHLRKHTVITGKVIDGKLVKWNIEPLSRKKDVTIYTPQLVVN